MKTKKKVMIILLVTVVLVAGAVLGYFALKKSAHNKKTVDVFPIGEVGMEGDFYYNNETMSGYVTTDMVQNVYLSSKDKVTEVYVQAGDVVHTGDVLLELDTTVQSLKLQSMRAEVEVARTDILAAERQLAKLQEIVPIEERPTEAPTTEAPTTEAPTTQAPTTQAPTTESQTTATPSDATEEPPTTEAPTTEAPTTETPTTETPSEDFEEPSEDDYTREELDKAIKDKKQEIKSLKITYQMKQLDLEIEERKSANGQIICTFDGIVKTVEDQEEAILNNKPFIVVSGSDGYAVRSSIGELSLGKYHVGDSVSLNCYDNGMYYTGTIAEISATPSEDNYYYSAKVQSYYDVIIIVEDAEDLQQGMYMEISYDSSFDMNEGSGDFYIPLAFVQKEGGKYFVMKDVDGVLKKEFVKTGDILWGDMIAIKSGVSTEDYLALPTAKNAKEGIRTVQKDTNALYGY